MGKTSLPDPQWCQPAPWCAACGYSLDGLPSEGPCPECGAHYEPFRLVLWGVPNKSVRGSRTRKILWSVIVLGCVAHSQLWMVELLRLGLFFLGFFTLALVGSVVAMLLTGPRERRATERFVITANGIARIARDFSAATRHVDTVFIPWGDSDSVQLERVSRFWRRLRIGRLHQGLYGPMRDVVFDAGIRCPDAQARGVQDAIQGLLPDASSQALRGREPNPSGQHVDLNPPPSAPTPP